jgi:hypothetical protein
MLIFFYLEKAPQWIWYQQSDENKKACCIYNSMPISGRVVGTLKNPYELSVALGIGQLFVLRVPLQHFEIQAH